MDRDIVQDIKAINLASAFEPPPSLQEVDVDNNAVAGTNDGAIIETNTGLENES